MRLTAATKANDIGGALTAPEFAALMAPFQPLEKEPVLAVAVSGGRDSLSLTLLADEWARARGGRVLGLIVDHALRAESGAEASATADLLRQHGIAAEILVWSGAKPSRGVQEAARKARYGLMLDACRRQGILHLLVAHQADDQGETIAMRAAHASGADGLAGMAAMVEREEVRILRPLLGIPRARLTMTLLARSVGWIDDPSNDDPRFERVRVRRDGKSPSNSGLEAAARRMRAEAALAGAAVEILECDLEGAVAFGQAAYGQLPSELRLRLLSRLVQALGRADHPPRRARLEQAVARLCQGGDRGKSGKGRDFTLLGCRLMLRHAGNGRQTRWIVRPESGRNDGKNRAQPLIPAGFFACGAPLAHHLD